MKIIKKCTLFDENTNRGQTWRRDHRFTWSSEAREGQAACSAKAVPSFLSYFKTLSIGPALGTEPTTFHFAVKLSTD